MTRLFSCLALICVLFAISQILVLCSNLGLIRNSQVLILVVHVLAITPLCYVGWVMAERLKAWLQYGEVKCCFPNCPMETTLKKVYFPLLGVEKMVCHTHIDAVVNSRGQRVISHTPQISEPRPWNVHSHGRTQESPRAFQKRLNTPTIRVQVQEKEPSVEKKNEMNRRSLFKSP